MLKIGQKAPNVTLTDQFSTAFSTRGGNNYILLCFERFTGCPVCNFRVRELLKAQALLVGAGIKVVLVYESSQEELKSYLSLQPAPFSYVSDPERLLFQTFETEVSMLRVMKGVFHGLVGKAMSGRKISGPGSLPSPKGTTGALPAEFLIDKDGNLLMAHYAKYLGDDPEIDTILNLAKS